MKIIGLKKKKEIIVTNEMSACNIGSGFINILSTPSIIIYSENLCAIMLEKILYTEKFSTVGIEIFLKHIVPTPIGNKISILSKIIFLKKKIIKFNLEIFDNDKLIAYGHHTRAIINKKQFLVNLNIKKATN